MIFPILIWGIFFLGLANCWNGDSKAKICRNCGKRKRGS